MEIDSTKSKLETLPDEILLEICKYLLCGEVLQSFVGLNHRMTNMITFYRQNVSLHKISISQSHYLSVYVLPQIGYQVRSLTIDCCYSVLLDQLFQEYFANQMSTLFPHLKRLTLVAYGHDQLIKFLDSLYNLKDLVEIILSYLFSIEISEQIIVVRKLFRANNNQITSILMDDQSSCLHFDDNNQFLNIKQLRINLKILSDLSNLAAAVPNVEYLDVFIQDNDNQLSNQYSINFSPLINLKRFRLKSVMHSWTFEELSEILVQMPNIEELSLFLFTMDERLIDSEIIVGSLSSKIKEFNYGIYFYSFDEFSRIDEVLKAWSSFHPIKCYCNERYLYLHTIPWKFDRINFSELTSKLKYSSEINFNDCETNVQKLDLNIDASLTLTKSVPILSQFRCVREININITNILDNVKEEDSSKFRCRKLSRLIQIDIRGKMPQDLKYFSLILNVTPNLFRLDIPLEFLLELFQDEKLSSLLGQRILSLSVLGNYNCSPIIKLQRKHIPKIKSVFSRVRDLYFEISHLFSRQELCVDESSSEERLDSDFSDESSDESYKNPTSLRSESMLIYILKEFQDYSITGLCVDGKFMDEIKLDPYKWLNENTTLSNQIFKANFNQQMNRLIIWM